MDASGNIGFGAACPLPGGIVIFFYGKWTSQELTIHINEKESLVSYWELVLFGNVTPTFCANMRFTRVYSNERIDNTVAISVAHKNSGKSWRLSKLAQKRAPRMVGYAHRSTYTRRTTTSQIHSHETMSSYFGKMPTNEASRS